MKTTSTRDYLTWLLHDAGLIEVCHIDRWPEAAWFTVLDPAIDWARQHHRTGNLYTTLGKIDRDAIHEYAHQQQVAGRRGRTPDECVTRWTRLFFDFDPERPAGTASTDAELAEANERMKACRRLLEAHDWPAPAIAMSGNGWHLQYRAPLPNTPEFGEALAVIYGELHRRLSDDVVSFDRSVRNPARLCTLYGSRKRKGLPTAERPHRQSWINVPSDWRQVLPQQVMRLAERWAQMASQRHQEGPQRSRDDEGMPTPKVNGKGAYETLDVVAWFQAHDHYQGHSKANIHRVLCPWSHEHTTSPTTGAIVYEADGGWPGFKCQHAHCTDRTIRDVLALWPDADQFCSAEFQSRRAA
ncbi:hypothetical protein [Thiohalocapsa marina]|uniref:hypothetical protein n=1 Tax=Thiohalocapsa marina TaxID=424902 RepID=UPI0036DA712A